MNYELISKQIVGRSFKEQGKTLQVNQVKKLQEGKTVVFTDHAPKVFYEQEFQQFLEQYFPEINHEVNPFRFTKTANDPMQELSTDDIILLLEHIVNETGNTEFRLNCTAEGWKLYVVKTAYRVVGPYKQVLIMAYRHFEQNRKPNPRFRHTSFMKPYTLKP